MKYREFIIAPNSEFIQNCPDAIKVVELTNRKARRYADLTLHLDDMNFAENCLNEIGPTENIDVRQALWRCAIIHYAKCFGKGSRSKIDCNKTLKGEAELALAAHKYFISLRDKNIAHDVNPFSQCKPGAIINKDGVSPKVAHIIGATCQADTLDYTNHSNLKNLTARAIRWIKEEKRILNDEIIHELNQMPHEDLLSMEQLILKRASTNNLTTDKATF